MASILVKTYALGDSSLHYFRVKSTECLERGCSKCRLKETPHEFV